MQPGNQFRTGVLTVLALIPTARAAAAEARKDTWPTGRVVELNNFRVSLSQPVLVARRHDYLWFPTITKLANGDLLAIMSDYPDKHVKRATAQAAWSRDGGRTWSATQQVLYGDVNLTLPSGDQLLLPYYLYPRKEGLGAPTQVIPRGKQ